MVNGTLYSQKYNYAGLYCTKCGCSSLKHLFIELHKNELSNEDKNAVNTDTAKRIFSVKFNNDINNIISDTFKTFVLVRNPYLRAVSMYINKYIGENSHIKKSMKSKNVNNNHGESFTSFLLFLKELKHINLINKLDGHIYEQSYNMNISINNITVIKLENFEKDIKHFYNKNFKNDNVLINKINNLFSESGILHSNKTKINPETNNLIENVANFVFTDKQNIPTYDTFYNKETKKLVEEIYKSDFKLFGYKKKLPFSG
jgi:hypothetical protein